MHKNELYPVFLKLHQLDTLLVGAGNVGLEKLQSLLSNAPDARITIVAPRILEEVRALAERHPGCVIAERAFTDTDLEGRHLVICATDDPALHARIRDLASSQKCLINVADTPALCDLYLGSIVQKGSIKIAISTNGKSPTIAKRLKELMQDLLPDEMEELLDNMQQIRSRIDGGFGEKVRRLNEITRELSALPGKPE